MPIIQRDETHNLDLSRPQICLAGRFFEKTNVLYHAHDFTELILVTQGSCTMKADEKSFSASPGDLVVIPPRLPHLQMDEQLVGTTYIGFIHRKEDLNTLFRVISMKNDLYVKRWMEDIVDLHTLIYDKLPYADVVAGLILSILVRIRQIEHLQKSINTIHPKVQKAIAIIESHITKPIKVEQIAAQVNLSESHLTALFRQHLGCGLINYQQNLRMKLARKYLLDPYITVKQVARLCGYEDVNFFIRQFRKQYNMSPGKWRSQFEDNDSSGSTV